MTAPVTTDWQLADDTSELSDQAIDALASLLVDLAEAEAAETSGKAEPQRRSSA